MLYLKYLSKKINLWDVFMAVAICIIVFLLEYYGFINKFKNLDPVLFISFTMLLSLFLVFKFVKVKVWCFIINERINHIDKILYIIFVGEIFSLLSFFLFISQDNISKHVLLIITLFTFFLIEIRVFRVSYHIQKMKNKTPTLINIYDLLYNKITENNLILLEEQPIQNKEKDLFKNSLFVSGLESTLLNCLPKETYIFSLTASWGSGKTSIVNLLKEQTKENKKLKIKTFSPWKYKDEYSLFEGFADFIYRGLGNGYGYINHRKIYKKYKKIIFGIVEKKYDIPLQDFFDKSDENIFDDIKKDINDYISFSSEKMVVVIDDIDRLNKDQVLLIFNIVKNVFHFNNLIYILCFDEETIIKLFDKELHIDPNYLDKIIQHKIALPKKDDELIKNIGIKCVQNMLSIYKTKINDETRLITVLEIVFRHFIDLRQIIRFLNSVSSTMQFFKDIGLDVSDLVALEYIKHTDIALYSQLATSSNYLVSEDIEFLSHYKNELEDNWDISFHNYADIGKYDREAKKFFDNLFGKKEDIVELLSHVFLNVDLYQDEILGEPHFYEHDDDKSKNILNARCCNGKFFNTYFDNTPNSYTKLNKKVDAFIENINISQQYEIEFDKLKKGEPQKNLNLMLELINWRIEDIKNLSYFINYLISTYMEFENEFKIVNSSLQSSLVTLFVSCINNTKSRTWQEFFIKRFLKKDVRILDMVLHTSFVLDETIKDKYYYNCGEKLILSELRRLIKDEYNLYSKEHYKFGFFRIFYNLKDSFKNSEINKIKNYLHSIINKDTVFRFIGDCLIPHSYDDYIYYLYDKQGISKIVDDSIVKEALRRVDYYLNADQQKLYDFYQEAHLQEEGMGEPLEIDFSNL